VPKRTSSYNSWQSEKLANPETAAAYLSAAISDSPEMFRKALRNVAQSRQMARVAREAGVTRESLYRATSDVGNPTLDTLASVLKALDLKMEVRTTAALKNPPAPLPEDKVTGRPSTRFAMKRGKPRRIVLDTSGAQLAFNFTPSAAIQQSYAIASRTAKTVNAVNENVPPAYLSNILLERDYGYSEATNSY